MTIEKKMIKKSIILVCYSDTNQHSDRDLSLESLKIIGTLDIYFFIKLQHS